MKSSASSNGSLPPMLLVGVLVLACCAGPFVLAVLASGALSLLVGAHQTLVADVWATVVVLAITAILARARRRTLFATIRDASHAAFAPPARVRSLALMLLLGIPLALFYLVALPAERFGALSWGALQFLTAGDAIAAALLGFGVPLSIAINFAARRVQAAQTTLTFGGVVAALLPSSLCCTTLIPSALAALGASAPAIMHVTGRYQGFFAQFAAAFIGFAVAAVLFSLWLAASNLVAGCATCPITKES